MSRVTEVGDIPAPLQGEVLRILQSAVPQADPVLIHLLGPPGSGKSTVAALLAQATRASCPTIVAFDQLMESVPAYRDSPDREDAFRTWELPAREAGYTLLRLLLGKRITIILDHSGAVPSHVELLRHARQSQHYYVAVIRVLTPLETAASRIAARHTDGGRFVPLHYLADRHAAIEVLLDGYRSVAHYYADISNELDGVAGRQFLADECLHLAGQIHSRRPLRS